MVKTLVRSTIFVWDHIYTYGEWQRKFSAEFWDSVVFPNKLVKIVLLILQNIASVSGWGRGRVHKILQYISWTDICSAKIWNGNVITTVGTSWCITNVATIFANVPSLKSKPITWIVHHDVWLFFQWRQIFFLLYSKHISAKIYKYL